MQTLISNYRPLIPVNLPWAGRQHYMHTLDIANPTMPEGFEDYTEIVKGLLRSVGLTVGAAYVTVDERVVVAGTSQRKPGPHVDGHFSTTNQMWNHYCNNLPLPRMPIIVASDIAGCRAWRGEVEADPAADGDLSHLRLSTGKVLDPNMAYLFSPDCIHESATFAHDTKRTFLRIALPVGSVQFENLS